MNTARSPWTRRACLLGLTVVAFGLRVWGTSYGFPLPWARPDEDRWVRVALGLLENPDPRWFEWPTLHGYLLAAVYWVWGQFRVWRGDFATWHAFLNEDPSVYLADLTLLGRFVSVVLGAAVIPLMYRLGERTGTRATGFLAAFWMAVSFGPVRDAHWALIEALLLLGIVLTLLLILDLLDTPTLGRFVGAGIATGLATSAKYSGVTLAAGIVVAAFLVRRKEGKPIFGTLWDPRLVAAGIATIVAFFAGSPFILVSRAQFMAAMSIREWSYRDASFGTSVGFIHHLVFSIRYSQGLLMEVVGILGLVYYGLKDGRRAIVLAYGLVTYVALGPARIVPMRYASSLAPAVVLGAAWALCDWASARRRPALAMSIIAVVLAVEPVYRDLRFDMLLTRDDTRNEAKRWLDVRLAPLTRILARDSKSLRWGRPLLEDRFSVTAYSDRLARRRTASYAVIAEAPNGYVPFAPEIHVVLKEVGSVVAVFDPYGPRAAPIYDPHDAFFVPVAGFTDVRRPGPRITIYGIREESPPPR